MGNDKPVVRRKSSVCLDRAIGHRKNEMHIQWIRWWYVLYLKYQLHADLLQLSHDCRQHRCQCQMREEVRRVEGGYIHLLDVPTGCDEIIG